MAGRPHAKDYGRIQLRVAEVAARRGYLHQGGKDQGTVNITHLAQDMHTVTSSVWPLLRAPDRRAGITFELMARLCAVLECSPSDLFEYLPPGAEAPTGAPE